MKLFGRFVHGGDNNTVIALTCHSGINAAAYNAGPQRVRDFLAGSRDLPSETCNYVLAITGHPIEDWKAPVTKGSNGSISGELQTERTPATCRDLLEQLERASHSVVVGWQQRNVPSWCRGAEPPQRRCLWARSLGRTGDQVSGCDNAT